MGHTVCLYHAEECWDGLVAAWSLGLDPQTTTYIPYDHGKPDAEKARFRREISLRECRVIAVDCFPEWIRAGGPEVIVIDHHESARERLEDRTGLTEVVFDMTHSAAVLAWRWAHPGQPVPVLNQFVEDRDLWAWKMNYSDAVNAYISTKPMTFEAWEWLQAEWRAKGPSAVVAKGRAILDYQAQVIQSAVKRAQVRLIDGVRCAVVNATTLVSETGHALVEGTDTPVALLYRIDGDTLNVSVRTAKNSPIKANEIAARFGGGGHPEAAGFHLPLTADLLSFLATEVTA